jgi:antitoxin VapB
MRETARAKIFMHGRSQAVRLPKDFRLPGTEVNVSRIGDKVILEPIDDRAFDPEKFWAALDALRECDFPENRDDDLRPDRDADVDFD